MGGEEGAVVVEVEMELEEDDVGIDDVVIIVVDDEEGKGMA